MRFIGCRMTPFKGRFSRSANRESVDPLRSKEVLATVRDPAGPTPYAVFNAPDGAPFAGVEEATSLARSPAPGGRTENKRPLTSPQRPASTGRRASLGGARSNLGS